MVHCFAPGCNHHSESHICKCFGFPSKNKKPEEYRRWVRLIRRKDREPGEHARVCSCHFRDESKAAGPEIYERNIDKIFLSTDTHKAKKRKYTAKSVSATVTSDSITEDTVVIHPTLTSPLQIQNTILEAEVDVLSRTLETTIKERDYCRFHYSVSTLKEEVIHMETGIPTKPLFDIIVKQVNRFQNDIVYFSGWMMDSICIEDQICITLMKLRQNYTNLHLAELFQCSPTLISNVVTTFIHVLHELLFKGIMTKMPSQQKNRMCSPSSFNEFSSCRVVIDCTDIEIATPSLMSQQSVTYSSYRGFNSFKVIVGVAPNAVITYISDLYPGSISHKEIVIKSGFLDKLVPGDMILADKGFLIYDIVPKGVSVNIPPFLQHGKFTESEIKVTKGIARCRIHVEGKCSSQGF